MGTICQSSFSVADMGFTINKIAYNAYKNHIPNKNGFSPEAENKVAQDLLQAISERFYGNNLRSQMEGKEELLLEALDSVAESIKIAVRASKAPYYTIFTTIRNPLPLAAITGNEFVWQNIFDDFIGNVAEPSESIIKNDTALTVDEEDSIEPAMMPPPGVETMSELIRSLFGKMNMKHFDPTINFFKHVASTSWVDGRVDSDGMVDGFSGITNVAIKIRSQLEQRIYDYFHRRANIAFSASESNAETKYLLFSPDRRPTGFVSYKKESGVELGTHKDFASVTLENGTVVPVHIVIANSMEEAKQLITAHITHETPNESAADLALTDFMTYTITDPEYLGDEISAYYAHIITKGNNFTTFLKYNYPSLGDAYQNRAKTSWSEPGETYGPDQDSAAMQLHKQATPRLVVKPNGDISVDSTSSYLNIEDFNNVAHILSELGTDAINIGKELELRAKEEKSNPYIQSVLYSIYYRFFEPDDYPVSGFQNLITAKLGTQKLRSYTGIINSQANPSMTLEEYEALSDRSIVPESTNAALKSSLSNVITSLRSIQQQDVIQEVNGRQKKSNTSGNGIDIYSFNTNFVEHTTWGAKSGIYTRQRYLKKGRVLVSSVSNKNKIQIAIKLADGTHIIYDADINKKEEGGKTIIQGGIPLTITGVNRKLEDGELALLFSDFGLDNSITSTYNIQLVKDALKSVEKINAKNYGVIETPDGEYDFTLDNLYLNMLFTMVLNGDKTTFGTVNVARNALGIAEDPNSLLAYNPIELYYGYKEALRDIVLRTKGAMARKYVSGFEGEKLASKGLTTSIKRTTNRLSKIKVGDINYGNILTPEMGEYSVGNPLMKYGFKLGNNHKTVGNMTEKENSMFCIETSFLQTALNSSNHNTVILQIGTQADRLHPMMTPFTAKKPFGIFIKEAAEFDRAKWLDDGKLLQSVAPISDLSIAAVASIKDLKTLLTLNKIPYNTLKGIGGLNLFTYANILEDINGIAYASDPVYSSGLDINKLSRRTLYVHQTYYRNLNTVATNDWNVALKTMFGTEFSFKTLQEVADYLKTQNILYSEIKAKSILTDSSMLESEERPDVEGKMQKYAVVPESSLQAIALFSNDTLGLMYIETMRKMFHKQLAAADYRVISTKSHEDVQKIMGTKLSLRDATDVLFDTYFYNAQILGVSALNAHTGGVAQYDLKEFNRPMFKAEDCFEDGRLNLKNIVASSKSIQVPGSDFTLETISVEELMALRERSQTYAPLKKYGKKLDRLAYMKIILDNNVAFPTDETKGVALFFNDFTKHQDGKFVSQVKRNGVLGTGRMMPRIVGIHEPGFYLGSSVKTVTVDDDEVKLKTIGLSGGGRIVATDGVQMIHELERIRYNNAIGNAESSFECNGAAIKSLTVDVDDRGVARYQKKAEFPYMSDDLVIKGSPEMDMLRKKAGTTITFSSKIMLVDTKGKAEWQKISLDSWKRHGLSYGQLQFIDGETSHMITSAELLYKIKKSTDLRDIILGQLMAGKYYTTKQERSFDNVQDMYEFFGAHTNPRAWYQVSDLIGYHSGNETKNIDLSDAVYPNRDAYIGKIGYTTQEKTGAKNIISWENLIDNNFKLNDVYTEVSNADHGPMLQAEHAFDTTKTNSAVANDSSIEAHDSEISLISQIISAVNGEGMSMTESKNIGKTLRALSKAALEGWNKKIVTMVIENNPTLAGQELDILEKLKLGKSSSSTVYEKEIREALEIFYRDFISKKLLRTQDDPGLAAELLSWKNIKELTFDQKQLLPLFQSQLFADFNNRAVKIKLKGGQHIVSPSHQFLPTYSLKSEGKVVVSGLSRDDMNKMFYGKYYKGLKRGSIYKNGIEESYPLEKITKESFYKVKLSDIVVETNPVTNKITEREFIHISNEIKERYKNIVAPEVTFEQFLESEILAGNYAFRFGKISQKGGDRLKWMQWTRHLTSSKEIEAQGSNIQHIFDTKEFKAYDAIEPIAKAFAAGTTYDKYYGLDLTIPAKTVKEKLHAKTFAVLQPAVLGLTDTARNILNTLVPENITKEYFFSNLFDATKTLPFPTALLTVDQLGEYDKWKLTSNPVNLLRDIYAYVGTSSVETPVKFKNKFKSYLYNTLQDEAMGWVTTPSEVYMPFMHGSVFFINDGSDGTKADSLFDLIGLNGVPTTEKLESLKILKPEEASKFSFDYETALKDFKRRSSGRYHSLSKAEQDIFTEEYENPMRVVRTKLSDVFTERVKKAYPTTAKDGIPLSSKTNLFVFKGKSIQDIQREAIAKRNSSTVGSSSYNAMTDLIKNIQSEIDKDNLAANTWDLIKDARAKFIVNKVGILTNNFLKTLDFITARIPAQGKSYFTAGRIKNFVFSSKNSVYGPLELILFAGLDYDIDKQNMMTWAVDEDGKVIDWNQFMDNNDEMSYKLLEAKIAEDAETIASNFEQVFKSAQDRIDTLKESGDPSTDKILSDKINKVENFIVKQKKKLSKELEESDKSNRILFTSAGQNFIVHNLVKVISNPKNAMEASTVSSMEKVFDAAKLPDIKTLFTAELGIEDLFINQKITSNVNSYSTIQYEKVNMDGKASIGINASDLKGYFAAYYATTSAEPSEKAHVALKSDLLNINSDIASRFGVDNTAMQFFKQKEPTITMPWSSDNNYNAGDVVKHGDYVYTAQQDIPVNTQIEKNIEYWKLEPEIITMRYLANAEKWSESGVKLSDDAKRAFVRLKGADEMEQVAILSEYLDSVQKFNSMNVDVQAWEELSELLSAATDNAKELILGKIGVNSTTNSMVSTMIRLGVGLKNAVDLINKTDNIIKVVERSGDLKTRKEMVLAQEEKGVVKGEEYAARILEVLKEELKKVTPPTSTSTDTQVMDYLTNPARLLYTYAKATQEFSVLAKLLSINQGLKNSAFEVFSYVDTLNNSVNTLIQEYNENKDNEPIGLTFDLFKFIRDVSDDKTENVNALLEAMDKIRTGINIPFVLVKNSYYFGYFEALMQAKTVRDSLSFVNEYTERIINLSRQENKYRHIPLDVFSKVSDTIYGFGILKYLDKYYSGERSITLGNNVYDLSKPRGDTKSKGRYEFLQDIPEILYDKGNEFANNEFVKFLHYDRPNRDPLTGDFIKLLKGENLNTIPSDVLAKLQIGLEEIKLSNAALYDALFLYSLIINKGSYSGGSFIGVFPIERYMEFAKDLKTNEQDIKNLLDNNNELIVLLNPLLLRQISTVTKQGEGDVIEDTDYDPFIEEVMNSTDFTDTGGDYVSPISSLTDKKFILDGLNESKLHETSHYVRSRDNGLTYQYNTELQIWVPITLVAPEVGMPYKLPTYLGMTVEEMSGRVQGFEVSLGTVDYNTGMMDTGRVVAYITRKMQDSSTMSPKMKLLLQDSRARNKDIDTYIVNIKGSFRVMTKEELQDNNPSMKFNKGQISLSPTLIVSSDSVLEARKKTLYIKDGVYYDIDGGGYDSIQIGEGKFINSNVSVRYTDSTKDVIDSLKNVPDSNIEKEYTEDIVNKEFTKYTNEIIAQTLAIVRYNGQIEFARKSMSSIDMSTQDGIIVTSVKSSIRGILGYNPSIVKKVSVLSDGEKGLKELIQLVANTDKVILPLAKIKYPNTEKVPSAIVNFVKVDTVSNLNKIDLTDFKALVEMLKQPSSVFNKYMEGFMADGKIDLVTFEDHTVYYKKNDKITASKQLTSLNDKADKNKPIYLPTSMRYEYSKPASKEVLFALTKHLNARLPGVTWVLMSEAEILEKYGEDYSVNKAFFKADGRVIINSDKATLETPFHEFGHIYLQYVMTEDPAEYQRLMDITKEHDLYKVMGKTYKNLSNTDLAEEVFCELLSLASTDKLMTANDSHLQEILGEVASENKPFGKILKRFTDWLKSLFFGSKKLKLDKTGYLFDVDLNLSDSLSTVISNLSEDIVFGKTSFLNGFSETAKDNVMKSRDSSTLTIKESRDILIARGYIEWYCV